MIDRSPLLPAVYILGIVSMILSIGDLLGLSFRYYLMIFTSTTLLTMVFWYLYTRHKRIFIYATGIITVTAGLIMIPQVYSVTSRIKYLVTHNYPLSGLSLDTVFLLTTLVLLTFFLFCLEFVIRSHALMFAIGIVLMILTPIFGHTMAIPNMVMLVLFETGFAVINMTERRSIKNVMKMKRRSRINVLSMVLVFAIAVIALVPALIIERSNENELFSLAYQTDNLIKEGITRLMGDTISGDLNGGSINRGNLYQSGAEQLSVTVNKIPTETFYIKGFVGKNYSDSNWSNAYVMGSSGSDGSAYMEPFMDDVFEFALERYLRSSAEPLPYPYYYLHSDLSDPISELHYLLAKDTTLNDKYYSEVEIDGSRYLKLESEQQSVGFFLNEKATDVSFGSLSPATQKTLFVPYYGKYSPSRSITTADYSIEAYPNSFLSVNDIKRSDDDDELTIYKCIEDEYESVLPSHYTSYPGGTFKRLEELCKETPLTDLNSITTFILVTLQNRAVYTTTPGTTPYNKDVIDYFLFENGKGYCVHFASAATLMYRMYGIPARYVTGYTASPTDFRYNRINRGFFTATLTDKSAHAWVEIYLKDYGWVPVEVTPATDGLMHASYPGYNESVMRFIMDRYGWKFNGDSKATATTVDDNGDDVAAEASSGMISGFALLIIAAAAGVVAFLLIRRHRIIRSLSSMSCINLFDRIMRMLHYSKELTDKTGSEKDFPKLLSESISSLSYEDCERLINTLLTANYSNREVTPEDRDHVEDCCRRISLELYGRCNFLKKLSFRFIRAFI